MPRRIENAHMFATWNLARIVHCVRVTVNIGFVFFVPVAESFIDIGAPEAHMCCVYAFPIEQLPIFLACLPPGASAMDNSRSVVASTLGSASMGLRLVPFRLIPFVVVPVLPPALRQPPPPPPFLDIPADNKDDSELQLYARIRKDLIKLLEDDEPKSLLFRRRVRNEKIHRPAVMWTRVVKKLLLMMRYDRKTRSAIGA